MYNKIMKIRLDNAVANAQNISRTKAQTLIKEGCVFVDGNVQNKPSFEVEDYQNISVVMRDNYVSRAAYKLLKALDAFGVSAEGKRVLDMGSSTGGFVQVLLESGADEVLAVDVGKGELSPLLAKNPKVKSMEGRDIRTLSKEEVEGVRLVTGDLSFISLSKILPHVIGILPKIEMVLLFKPQFECGREIAKKYHGVIKDRAVHKQLLRGFAKECEMLGITFANLTFSPIKGGSGNIEYLLHLNATKTSFDIDKVVDEAFGGL